MANLNEKVISALAKRFRELSDGLDDVPGTGRVTGSVVSPDFRDMDYDERQRCLASALRSALTADELRQVGPIVALTPEEAQIDVGID